MKETEVKINWNEFDLKNSEDRLTVKPGVKYDLGFNAVKQSSMEVTDSERTEEGKVEVKKTIPTLILSIDYEAGKPVKKELTVSSKKLAATIRTYFEKGMLFTRFFELMKTGEGFLTNYQLLAMNDKPKQGAVAPASSVDFSASLQNEE